MAQRRTSLGIRLSERRGVRLCAKSIRSLMDYQGAQLEELRMALRRLASARHCDACSSDGQPKTTLYTTTAVYAASSCVEQR